MNTSISKRKHVPFFVRYLISLKILCHFFSICYKNQVRKWRIRRRRSKGSRGRQDLVREGERQEGVMVEEVNPEITLSWGKWYSPFIVPGFIMKMLLETMMHTSRVPWRAVNPVWRDSWICALAQANWNLPLKYEPQEKLIRFRLCI